MVLQPLFIGPIGPFETALIFMALVLLFGADKIPKLAESMGKSLSKFQEGKKKAQQEVEEVANEVEGSDEQTTQESVDSSDDVEETADN